MTETELLDKLAEGLAHREYSLFLGAGASVGATGGDGRPLPTGTGLRDQLVSEFNIDVGNVPPSLQHVYENLRRNQPDKLTKYLVDRFTNCKPNWQHLLAEFFWQRIWTLNIDDVLEQAFKAESRPLRSLVWHQRFSDPAPSGSQQLIHLHGSAARLVLGEKNDQELVFSFAEYAQAVSTPLTWQRVFFDQFAERPFLVIGARLTEEFDLAEVLQRGSSSMTGTGFPSVIVLPSITQFDKEQLESAGLIVVESEGENFINDLLSRYRSAESRLKEVYGSHSPSVARYLQQFIDLRTYQPIQKPENDFYSGFEPTWATILAGDDALFDVTARAAEQVVKVAMGDEIVQQVHLISGDPGGGKSACLLGVAQEIVKSGGRPFLFRADETLDIGATIEWLKLVPRTVMFFDDCGAFAMDIQRLAERCVSESVRLVVVGADRSGRLKHIRDRIDANFLFPPKTNWCGRLSDQDIDSILDKLHSRGRLGKITRWPKSERFNYFKIRAGRRLFDAMAELEGGAGFEDRISAIYQSFPTERLKFLYSAACLCYESGIPLPTGIAAEVTGMPPRELVATLKSDWLGVLLLTRTGIRPPHRLTASLVVNSILSREDKFDSTLALAKAIAPHIDRQAIRLDTREHRIIRQLMDEAAVIRHVGPKLGREWFDALRELYGWNGRYWDQRALFESKLGQHATARSYAERSIDVHPHPFSYNTLGTVLLRTAEQTGDSRALLEGIRNLDRSRSFAQWEMREHPYVTFFTGMLRFVQTWGIGKVPDRSRTDWTLWYREARSFRLFAQGNMRKLLEDWQKTWLDSAVSPIVESTAST